MREEHQVGGGRPLITVSEDYATLTNPNIVGQNSGGGPAKDVYFEFSASIKSSDGFVVSVLPFFKEELPSLCRKIVKALRQETGKGEAAGLFRVGLSSVKRYARIACKGSPFVPKKEPRQAWKAHSRTALMEAMGGTRIFVVGIRATRRHPR